MAPPPMKTRRLALFLLILGGVLFLGEVRLHDSRGARRPPRVPALPEVVPPKPNYSGYGPTKFVDPPMPPVPPGPTTWERDRRQ